MPMSKEYYADRQAAYRERKRLKEQALRAEIEAQRVAIERLERKIVELLVELEERDDRT